MERLAQSLTREVVALAAVAMWSIVAWYSLWGLVARGHVQFSAEGAPHDLLPPLLWLVVSSGAAVYLIRETGLLALVRRPATVQGSRSDWIGWLAHFKLSLAALSVTSVVAWLARIELLLWLLRDVYAGESPADTPWHWSSPAEQTQTEVLMVVAGAWIVSVPFLASDAWGLLVSRWNQRAARLRVPFAVVTGLAALVAFALVRELAQAWFTPHFGASQ
jgi:hypothetical protein